MGIGLLDLIFRVEREFGVKLERNDVIEMLHSGNASNPPHGSLTDIQVRDFVKLVEESIAGQNVEPAMDLYDRVTRQIVESLGCDDSEINPDTWMVKELGLE